MVNLPAKKDVTLALLERSTVYIHLDPRRSGVTVPPWFKNKPQLVLQVGLNMNIPIPDLEVDESGVRCTLSFNRSPHFCNVPWPAVYALVGDDGRGMVWPDDVPEEVVAQAQAETKQRDHLRAVPAGTEASEPKKSTRAASPNKRRDNADATASDASKRPRTRAKSARAKADRAGATPPVRGRKQVREKAGSQDKAASHDNAATASRKPVRMRVEAAPTVEASKNASTAGGATRRRELPPYLRVVK
jgi:stringent starvation protein B